MNFFFCPNTINISRFYSNRLIVLRYIVPVYVKTMNCNNYWYWQHHIHDSKAESHHTCVSNDFAPHMQSTCAKAPQLSTLVAPTISPTQASQANSKPPSSHAIKTNPPAKAFFPDNDLWAQKFTQAAHSHNSHNPNISPHGQTTNPSNPSTQNQKHFVQLLPTEVQAMIVPFKFLLVGKFSYNRPRMEIIRNFFASLGLKEKSQVSLLDNWHVLIQLNLEEDYSRLWVKQAWYVSRSAMQIFKQTTDF